ncbi:hypothetical protein LTR17_017023 [Elasticomyces elasticus]|nr:hypothetical protein LTR17_017023 [Elasticomyces elasticus]
MATQTDATAGRPDLIQDIQDTQKSLQEGRKQLQSSKNKQHKATTQAADLLQRSVKLEEDLQTKEVETGRLRQKIKETKAATEIEDQNAATNKARVTKEEFLVKSVEARFNTLKDLEKTLEQLGYEAVKKGKRTAGMAGLAAPPGPEAKKLAVALVPVQRAPNQVNDPKTVDIGKQQLIIKLKVDPKALQAILNPKNGDENSLFIPQDPRLSNRK